MNEKFTPAPWLNNGKLVYSGALFIATSSTTDVDYQKAEANAALIAAAPEMYEMLSDIYKAFFVDLTTDNMPSAKEVSDLLAKARGDK